MPESARLPTRAEILEFIGGSQIKVGKKEIARAFSIRGAQRSELKLLLAEMTAEGQLIGNRKALRQPGRLPSVAMIEIIDRDDEGDLIGAPIDWDGEDGPRPRVRVAAGAIIRNDADQALGLGDRLLARIVPDDEQGLAAGEPRFIAEPIKKLTREKRRLLGIFRAHARGGGIIDPIERRELKPWPVRADAQGGAGDGDLVRFNVLRTHRTGVPEARVAESLGNPGQQHQISLIAVHAHGIPDEFPAAVLREAERLPALDVAGRVDLTQVPLVTIDPVDARDHDDAVHARPDPDPRNPGGVIVTVAIADVAAYVRPGTRLDREALLRGNSVYFPDRVVPMLPERISNDLCSLREGEKRPCLAVEMTFDAEGRKRRHAFARAIMRSAAKLSYQEAQSAIDGQGGEKAQPLLAGVLEPLWAAYRVLAAGRDARQPLDLNIPERKIEVKEGHVTRVTVPPRLEAHRLIEEFMIQANVAAAETLEEKRTPLVYRVHERPSKEKQLALADFLSTLDIKAPKSETLTSADFNRILERARDLPVNDLINEVVLRSQAQAVYDTANVGHFGLNLKRYAHFTSPIRRYADLIVHRALIRALKMGSDGLPPDQDRELGEHAKAISEAERRAMMAERETSDRLLAAFLSERVGAQFSARISGITRSGLFVRLKETGADGSIPASTIEGDYWRHDEAARALVGDRTGRGFRLGDDADVKLVEAIPSAGALRFEMLSEARQIAQAGRGRRHVGSRSSRSGPRPKTRPRR